MVRNISINISGIIFHIEEDGYERLKKYLDSINRYFSSFEDSAEILADIESRIAEIFLSKLSEGKQVITAEDVNALISTMGSVSDFRAAEADEGAGDRAESSDDTGSKTSEERGGSAYQAPKQLVRDEKRKILGGVCAGIAHYANVDPVWIRLLFALTTTFYGITFLIYTILWVAMPGSYDIEEPADNKKMFRDPEKKVLAGVSGGVAAYFGIDITVVRILFIVFTFLGGIGFMVYIVLWVILPEAHTLTDRMQMQGEPVTLSNIESNIKKGLDLKEGADESTLTKILLFPFRVIAFLITGLAKILTPLVEVIRVAIGIVAAAMGVGFIFVVVVSAGAILGLITFPAYWDMVNTHAFDFPIESIREIVPAWVGLTACMVAIIPGILMFLLGFSIIARRNVITQTVGWTLFVLFFAGIGLLSYGGARIALKFRTEATYKSERTFSLDGKTAILKVREPGYDDGDYNDYADYDRVELRLRGYDGELFKLEEHYEAHGTNRQDALANARMVTYNVTQEDSILVFDPNLRFKDDAVFRAQELNLYLYIPYNHPFVMDEEMSRFISQYVDYDHQDGHTWIMTRDGLQCTDCPEESATNFSDDNDLTAFDAIDLRGAFDVSIRKGDTHRVEFAGPDSERSKYDVYRSGQTLVIRYKGKNDFDFKIRNVPLDEVRVNITTPSLESLEAVGLGSVRFEELTTDAIYIDLKGPVHAQGELNAGEITLRLNGSAEADLSGTARKLTADIKFASSLNAYNLEVEEAVVKAVGASSAKVHVTGNLEIDEGVASDIDFTGNPQVSYRK